MGQSQLISTGGASLRKSAEKVKAENDSLIYKKSMPSIHLANTIDPQK